VGNSAALYDTGPTPSLGVDLPTGAPGVPTLHYGRPLTFTSFAPFRRRRVDHFGGPFELNRASLNLTPAGDQGASVAELTMPGRAYIPNFNMGSSISLPSLVSGSIVRGDMSLKFPRFRYRGQSL
jgi:hypothetical protein